MRRLAGETDPRTSRCFERSVPNSARRPSARWFGGISCAAKCWSRKAIRRIPCLWCCTGRSPCTGAGIPLPFAELRAGELVGEIGFFANVPRTANVVAIRDTSVLVLTRAAYLSLAADTPAIAEALLAALALRFAKRTERLPTVKTSPMARTVALIDGGLEPVPVAFDRCLREALAGTDAEIVDPARVEAIFPGRALDAA